MYKIEKKKYGFYLTFGGFIKKDEMENWIQDSLVHLKNVPDSFGVLVDLRTLKPLPPESQPIMENGQKQYKKMGMIKSVVILNNPIVTMQFKRIGKETGIYSWERYIDASSVSNWEAIGIDWIENGVDPDL